MEGLILKFQYFGHLMRRADLLEKILMLEKRVKAEGEEGDRGWDDRMASRTQWTWTWTTSGRWWETGKPGVLQSMGWKESDMTWQLKNNNYTYTCTHTHIYVYMRVQSLVGKIPWRKTWQPTLVFLHGESHGQRSLPRYSP